MCKQSIYSQKQSDIKFHPFEYTEMCKDWKVMTSCLFNKLWCAKNIYSSNTHPCYCSDSKILYERKISENCLERSKANADHEKWRKLFEIIKRLVREPERFLSQFYERFCFMKNEFVCFYWRSQSMAKLSGIFRHF